MRLNIELEKKGRKKREARTAGEGLTMAMHQREEQRREKGGGGRTEKARKRETEKEGGAEGAAGTGTRDHRVIIYGVYGGSVNRKGS